MPETAASGRAHRFVTSFAADLRRRAGKDRSLPPFVEALDSLAGLPESANRPEHSSHPILRYAGPLLERACGDRDIVDTMRAICPDLIWYQIFQGAGIDPVLAEGLFAAQIAGPAGLFASHPVRAGLFLLGPNIRYPLHSHAATELYYGLSGRLTLRHGWNGEPFVLGAEDHSVTPSSRLHALETADSPVLLAYVWIGAIEEPNWWWERRGDGTWCRICWVRTPSGAWIKDREEPVPDDLLAAQS